MRCLSSPGETGKSLRFVVKQSLDTHEVRCFGSTRTDYKTIQAQPGIGVDIA